MQWNVFRYDSNSNKIVIYDIFNDHASFAENVKKWLKKCDNKEEFAEKLKSELLYYYWCKSEHEIVVTPFPPRIKPNELERLNNEYKENSERYGHPPYSLYVNPDCGEKVDIYSQVMLNWDIFLEYVWGHKKKKKV